MHADEAPAAPARRARPLWLIVAVLLASSLTVMAGATMSPSVPGIAAHFSDTPAAGTLARFVLTVPSLFIAVSAPLAGYLADRFGRLPLLYSAMLLYVAGGTTGLYLDTLLGILVGRAILGISVGGIMTVATTLISDYFDSHMRQRVFGLQAAFMAFGASIFVLLGGGLAELHWRGPFVVYLAPLAMLAFFARVLDEPGAAPGQAGESAAQAKARGRLRYYPGLLRFAAVIYVVTVTFSIAFYFMPTQLPFRLAGLGFDRPIFFAAALVLMTLATGLLSTLFERYKPYFRYHILVAIGFAGMGAGLGVIALAGGFTTASLGAVIAGAGLGVVQPTAMLWLMDRAPPAVRGRLAGGVTTAIFFGHFLSPLVSQPAAGVVGLPGAFIGIAGLLAVLAVAFALWGNRLAGPGA